MKHGGFLQRRTQLKSYSSLKQNTGKLTRKPLERGNTLLSTKTRLRPKMTQTRVLPNGDIIWSTWKADRKFSRFIRDRDGECKRCHTTEKLTCSHFHGRSHKATRFIPDNADTFCEYCHAELEHKKKPGQEYYEMKLNELGPERFKSLAGLAKLTFPEVEAVKNCMKLLSKL